MSRTRAAAATAATLAAAAVLGWAIERWPSATLLGISAGSLYATYRRPREPAAAS